MRIARLMQPEQGGIVPTNLRGLKGDITKLAVNAIINAANSSLLGGGGVDGAFIALPGQIWCTSAGSREAA